MCLWGRQESGGRTSLLPDCWCATSSPNGERVGSNPAMPRRRSWLQIDWGYQGQCRMVSTSAWTNHVVRSHSRSGPRPSAITNEGCRVGPCRPTQSTLARHRLSQEETLLSFAPATSELDLAEPFSSCCCAALFTELPHGKISHKPSIEFSTTGIGTRRGLTQPGRSIQL
jgi:hypothetical protein